MSKTKTLPETAGKAIDAITYLRVNCLNELPKSEQVRIASDLKKRGLDFDEIIKGLAKEAQKEYGEKKPYVAYEDKYSFPSGMVRTVVFEDDGTPDGGAVIATFTDKGQAEAFITEVLDGRIVE